MKTPIKIPRMGESITEATVSRIMKQSGSQVAEQEEILELETEKVNQVLYAPESGRLILNVTEGQKVKVDQEIGSIDTDAKGETVTKPEVKKEVGKGARKMAPEFVAELKAPPPQPLPPPSTPTGRKKMSSLRKTIADRLVEAKNKTAMLTTFNEVDMSAVMNIRAKEKDNFAKRYGARLGFMSFFVKATVAALKEVPAINSYIEGDEIVSFPSYDIGIAISTDRGLMVPVVRSCDQLSFGQIEKTIEELAAKARDGKITIDEMRGGCFTITNGGTFGSLLSTPILNPPQSGILGMHTIAKRAVVVGDQIVIRPMMYVALSYDHRVVDGREAILFLVKLKESLEDPSRLLLDL